MPDQPATVPFLDVSAGTRELEPRLSEAVTRVVASGWYLLGAETAAFEREFAAYVGARCAVGVGNGLDAITLALRALDVGPGDEVIVPANTYIATWIGVTRAGATPVGVEPKDGEWNIDPSLLDAVVTPRTRAIVPVHLYGQPADLAPILEFARRHRLVVIEDAAQAHGARYEGRRIGAHGDAVAWSFYPGKNLGAMGDGGAVTTNDPSVAERVRALGNYGSKVRYHHDLLGYNSRLDEVQAAVLCVKLAHLDAWNARRCRRAAEYATALADVQGLALPRVAAGRDAVWHLYVVDHDERDALLAHLAASGVQALIHYPIPPHLSGAYAHLGLRPGAFPIAERAARTHLSLPMGPHLTDAQFEVVVQAVRSFGAKGERRVH
jgi:dTDP-4-amino-4,6-dideoxygalactose transaminase